MQSNTYSEYGGTEVKIPYVNYNEITNEPRPSRKRDWKPFALRTPFLIMTTVVLLICIGALEVLVRRSVPFSPPASQPARHKRLLMARSTAPTTTQPPTTASTFYTNPDARVGITSTTPNTVISTTKSTVTPYTVSDARVQITTSSSYSTIVGSIDPSVRVQITTSSIPATTAKSTSPDGRVQIISSTPSSSPSSSRSTSPAMATPSGARVGISSSSTTSTTGTKSHTSSTSTQTNLSDKISSLSKPDLQVTGPFTHASYFMALFLPSIIAVLLRELWAIIACSIKLIEPFCLLSRPEGASARESFVADYLSESSSWHSVKAAFRGSLAMIVVLVINGIMSIAAPLASESMTAVVLTKYKNENGEDRRENLAWVLFQPLVRTLQGLLAFIALTMILLTVLNKRRNSGLSGNPSRLVTMASLLNHPSIIQDVQSIDHGVSDSQIVEAFSHNRYTISSYVDMSGNERYGLVKVGEIVPRGIHRIPLEDITAALAHEGFISNQKQSGHGGQLWRDGLSLVLIIGLLGIVVAYWLDGSDSAFNGFFNSGEFGPKFMVSLIASIITTSFQSFEREVRSKTPYQRLAARNARAKNTILRATNGTAVSNLFQSIRQATWFHLFIALTALSGNVLIIVVVGVPFGENITQGTYVFSTFASIAITALMLIAIITVFIWRRKHKKLNLPYKQNETLIRVWMSMSNRGNQLRAMLEDAGDMKEGAVAARVRREGGSYWAGWIRDERGRDKWCVDKEVEYGSAGYY